jgi:hypothetical protein
MKRSRSVRGNWSIPAAAARPLPPNAATSWLGGGGEEGGGGTCTRHANADDPSTIATRREHGVRLIRVRRRQVVGETARHATAPVGVGHHQHACGFALPGGRQRSRSIQIVSPLVVDVADHRLVAQQVERIAVAREDAIQRGRCDEHVVLVFTVRVVVDGLAQAAQGTTLAGAIARRHGQPVRNVGEIVPIGSDERPSPEAAAHQAVDQKTGTGVAAGVQVRLKQRVLRYDAAGMVVHPAHRHARREQGIERHAVALHRQIAHQYLSSLGNGHPFHQRDVALEPGDEPALHGLVKPPLPHRAQTIGVAIADVVAAQGCHRSLLPPGGGGRNQSREDGRAATCRGSRPRDEARPRSMASANLVAKAREIRFPKPPLPGIAPMQVSRLAQPQLVGGALLDGFAGDFGGRVRHGLLHMLSAGLGHRQQHGLVSGAFGPGNGQRTVLVAANPVNPLQGMVVVTALCLGQAATQRLHDVCWQGCPRRADGVRSQRHYEQHKTAKRIDERMGDQLGDESVQRAAAAGSAWAAMASSQATSRCATAATRRVVSLLPWSRRSHTAKASGCCLGRRRLGGKGIRSGKAASKSMSKRVRWAASGRCTTAAARRYQWSSVSP